MLSLINLESFMLLGERNLISGQGGGFSCLRLLLVVSLSRWDLLFSLDPPLVMQIYYVIKTWSFVFLVNEGVYGFRVRILWWSLDFGVGESMRVAIFLALRLNIKLKISKNLCDLILLKTHISHVKAQLITFSYDITLFAYILKIREV